MKSKKWLSFILGTLLLIIGLVCAFQSNVSAASHFSSQTSSPKLTQYFDVKIYNRSQKIVKEMNSLKKKGIEMALMPLPYTAFVKAATGSRVIVRQGKLILFDQVVKHGVGFLKTNPKKSFNVDRPVTTYAKLPHHSVSKVVHYQFRDYPGY